MPYEHAGDRRLSVPYLQPSRPVTCISGQTAVRNVSIEHYNESIPSSSITANKLSLADVRDITFRKQAESFKRSTSPFIFKTNHHPQPSPRRLTKKNLAAMLQSQSIERQGRNSFPKERETIKPCAQKTRGRSPYCHARNVGEAMKKHTQNASALKSHPQPF